jgi:hypothetical protein
MRSVDGSHHVRMSAAPAEKLAVAVEDHREFFGSIPTA